MWPHRWQPTRLPCPWDSPDKNTGVGCHFLLQCMKVESDTEERTKVCFSSSHVWMWEWTINKPECWRIDTFELWCWRRLLRVPWTARRLNQSILRRSILNIHWKNWCWSWSPSTLATWCKELTHWNRPWCWERLKVEGEGDDRGWDGWMASPTQWTWVC